MDARPPVEAQGRSTSVAFVKDPAGRDRYVNRHFLELFGGRLGSDSFGKTDADVWPADIAALVHRAEETLRMARVRPHTIGRPDPNERSRIP